MGRRGKALRRFARLSMEALEPRHVLAAANLAISEFMASNSDSLADGDGAFSDWIEINNGGTTAVDLADYSLTDDSTDLQRWAFPSRTIQPGEYLVVFASSPSDGAGGTLDNYVDAAGNLHTNFSLNADGEYLGLTYEDPVTHAVSVVHDFGPAFPTQRRDVSYGVAQIASEVTYLAPGAAAQTIVPTSGAYDAVWHQPGYVPDANWTSGTTGVGFGETFNGFQVRTYQANTALGSPIGATLDNMDEALEVIGNPAAQFGTRPGAGNYATVDFLNTGAPASAGHYFGDVAFPGQTNPQNYNHFATEVHGLVTIPAAGTWTFGIRSNEGFRLTVGENEMMRFSPGGSGEDQLSQFTFAAAGVYQLDLYHFEGAGDAWLELFAAQGALTAWDAVNFDLVGDVANGGLAVNSDLIGSNGASISQLLGTNLFSAMAGVNSTFYTRIPFNLDSPASSQDQLKLRMKYDDAFVAYLNGVEVARRNVTGGTVWNSIADSPRPVDEVLEYEEIDISAFLPNLVVGQNLLAIQGLNFSASDPDALVLPELASVDVIGMNNGYFTTPTPRAANGSGFTGFVDDTLFNVDRGFYSAPIDVTITTATPDAEIRYTLDGTAPTAASGFAYTAPLHITQTSIVRAAAFRPGYSPSEVSTQTYIFLNDVIQQSPTGAAPPGFPTGPVNGQIVDYGMDPDVVNSGTWGPQVIPALKALPTLSLVTPPGHLFDPGTGIWVNAQGQGLAWERTASLELINPPDGANPFGTSEFQIDMGMRIRGEFSRGDNNPKHGFRLFFRDDIGGELRYAWFGDEGAAVFEKMDLRVAQNWNWHLTQPSLYTYTRDVGARDLQGDLGEPYTRSRYHHMYINGQYWGIYQTEERPDDFYGATYLGGDEADYDVMKVDDDATVFATAGTEVAWGQFYALLNTLPQAATQAQRHAIFMQLQGLNPDGTRNTAYPVHLDVENLIDFMMVVNIWCSRDSPMNPDGSQVKNFFAMRDRTGDRGWVFFLHDVEWGILVQYVNESRSVPFSLGNQLATFNPQWAHQQLMYSDEYRLLFADYVQKYFFNDGPMTPANMIERHQERVDQLQLAIIAESARWGDRLRSSLPYTKNDWAAAVENVKANFFTPRTNIVLNQFKSTVLYTGGLAPLFPSINAPVFSKYGGEVNPGYVLAMSKPAGVSAAAEIYYTLDGSDPRLVGGAANPAAQHATGPINVTIDSARQVRARVKDGATWSAEIDAIFTLPGLFDVRISEIHYNPADHAGVANPDDLEFIELHNAGGFSVSLGGVQLTEFATTPYTIAAGTTLAAGERIIIARSPTVFQSVYGTNINVLPVGFGSANLSNMGERIALLTPLGQAIVDFVYDDASPWPTAADGGGASLEIIDPLGNPSDATNWRASVYAGGSPGSEGLQLAGDYDLNRTVDAGDHLQWRASFGLAVSPGSGADGNGDGVVDAADYVVWRKNVGASLGAALAFTARSASMDEEQASALLIERDDVLATLFVPPKRSAFSSLFVGRTVAEAFTVADFSDAKRSSRALLIDVVFSAAVDEVAPDSALVSVEEPSLRSDAAMQDELFGSAEVEPLLAALHL